VANTITVGIFKIGFGNLNIDHSDKGGKHGR